MMRLGIDVGSTTVKLILLDDDNKIIYQKYERHMSSVFDKVKEVLEDLNDTVGNIEVQCVITGSGGLALAEKIKTKFEQEVVTCSLAVKNLIPQTDVAIELGRRRCEDYIFWKQQWTEDERHLRRRHGSFYRSNGYSSQYGWRRT